MNRRLILLALAAGLPAATGASTLYKCTDESGVVLYTNQKTPRKSCTVLSQQADAPTPRNSTVTARAKPAATPSPSDFPRVSGNEQKARDSDRRAILDKELANEAQSLERARKALAEPGNQAPDKAQGLRDTVQLHERNVEALKKELANLR